jgi:hypothetical protein
VGLAVAGLRLTELLALERPAKDFRVAIRPVLQPVVAAEPVEQHTVVIRAVVYNPLYPEFKLIMPVVVVVVMLTDLQYQEVQVAAAQVQVAAAAAFLRTE